MDREKSWAYQLRMMYECLPAKGYLFYNEEEDKKVEAALEKDPWDYVQNYAKALLYHDIDPKIAMDSYGRCLYARPFASESYYGRGRKYLTMGRYELALADLEMSTRIYDQEGWYYHYKAVAYFFLERYEDARDAFIKAIEVLKAHDGDLMSCETDWLWMSYINLGDFKSAKKLLDDYDVNTPVIPVVGDDDGYKKRVLLLKGAIPASAYRNLINPNVVNEGGAVNDWHALARYYYHIEGNLEEALKCMEEVVKPRKGNYTWSWGYRYSTTDIPKWKAGPSPYRELLK